jgi:hypothetical protein
MLRASSWLLDPPFFTVKVLRRLTGILDEPGILGNYWEDALRGLSNVGNHASNIRLRIDVEVQKVGFLVRTRSEVSQLAEATLTNHMSLRRACQKGKPCPLLVSFLDSLFSGNIARIARLALLEWGLVIPSSTE